MLICEKFRYLSVAVLLPALKSEVSAPLLFYEKNLSYYKSEKLVEIREMLRRLIEKIEEVLKEL